MAAIIAVCMTVELLHVAITLNSISLKKEEQPISESITVYRYVPIIGDETIREEYIEEHANNNDKRGFLADEPDTVEQINEDCELYEYEELEKNSTTSTEEQASQMIYSADEMKYLGVVYWGNYRWTWYSEKVLPGGGLTMLNENGRHLDENGYVCDRDGYIALASCMHEKGTVLPTPLGKDGKVYDYCETDGTIDVYVGW